MPTVSLQVGQLHIYCDDWKQLAFVGCMKTLLEALKQSESSFVKQKLAFVVLNCKSNMGLTNSV